MCDCDDEKHHWCWCPLIISVCRCPSCPPCTWWAARNSVSVVLLTGTWPLLPFPRSQSRAWSYNYQTSSTNHGPVFTRPDQSERRGATTGLLAFTVWVLSLVWSLVMGDYSIPGSQSVCVTGESFSPSPLRVLLSHKLQILLPATSHQSAASNINKWSRHRQSPTSTVGETRN